MKNMLFCKYFVTIKSCLVKIILIISMHILIKVFRIVIRNFPPVVLDYCNTIKPIPVGAAKRRIFVETFFFAVPPCHIWFDSFSFVIIKRATFLIWPKGKCKYIYPCFLLGVLVSQYLASGQNLK